MKKYLPVLALAGLLVLAVGITANAGSPIVPTVTAVAPASAFNDIGTRITITGAEFVVETTSGVDTSPSVISTPPALRLGATPLTDVTWVDTQTLTATVPWGMNAGTYDLVVTNPGGGAATLTAAFEVKSGINSWNSGELNGAGVSLLLMQPPGGSTPDAPRSLYAAANEVGLFRSDDAGGSWHFTNANPVGNADFVLDPHHPDWLYSTSSLDGVRVSKDKGETWPTLLFGTSSDAGFPLGEPLSSEVFVSPNTTDTLFLGIYGDGVYPGYLGLRKSADGGAHWSEVADMHGIAVQNVAFDPTPGSHDMVLATSDARIFRSANDGATWSLAPSSPPVASMGFKGGLMYNPYYVQKPGEVWLVSTEISGGIFRSNPDLTTWTDVSQRPGAGSPVTFLGPENVYFGEGHSVDGGLHWDFPIGPWPTWGPGDYLFDPEDTHTVYFTNSTVGVQKAITGEAGPSLETSWTTVNQGLTGMRCVSMSISTTDPLRVYATFDGWGGMYVSDDGTSHWKYIPIRDSGQMWQVLQDPFDPGLLYATGSNFYTSTDGAEHWHDWGWNGIPESQRGLMGFGGLAVDPFQEGRLLVSARVGQSSVHDHDSGYLYSSDDHGATWSSVLVTGTAGSIGPIEDIEFDPEVPGTVYLASDRSGVFRSTDHGATWGRIDDPRQPDMLRASNVAIATHPQHVVAVLAANNLFLSSADGSPSWHDPGSSMGNAGIAIHSFYFVAHDSTRMYAPTYAGLFFSGDMGNTWSRSAGALGGVQVTTLADTMIDGRTLLYAATTGGNASAVWNPSAASSKSAAMRVNVRTAFSGTVRSEVALAASAPSALVGAGIYRKAQVEASATFTSSGSADGWVLESSHTSSKGRTVNSTSSTLRLGDDASKKQYRSVLSFGTSGLPDNAVITGVRLRVRRQGVTGGGDPVAKFQGFMADVRNGYLSTTNKLQAGDFQASGSKTVGAFKPSLAGGWYTIDLKGAANYINKRSVRSGVTQIRLRFKLDDNNNRTANYLSLYSGNASASLRPQLVVTYYVP